MTETFEGRKLWLPPTAAAARDAVQRDSSGKPVVSSPDGTGRRANPGKEYAARSGGSFWVGYRGKLQALPRPIDDLDMELGTDKLRIMMTDPQINSSIYLAALACMSRGLSVKPRITDKTDPRYEKALFYQRFVEYNLASLDTSFTETLVDMAVGAMVVGHCVAEQNFDLREGGEWDGKYVLKSIKPKSPEVYAFLVDEFGNNPALACYRPGNSVFPRFVGPFQSQQVIYPWGDISTDRNNWRVVPVQKFAILTNRRRYTDPRGYSALRPAYTAWYYLQQLWPEYMKYLVQFASPSIVGTLPEKAFKEWNEELQEMEDPIDVLYSELMNFGNGTAIALRYGSMVDLKWSQGDGTAFTNAINTLRHEIVKAILHQLLATEEGKHQARAASSTHQDVLNMVVRGLKNLIVSMIQRQIFKLIITLNFGAVDGETLAPWCSLGDIAQEDKSDMIKSYSQAGWKLGPTQYAEIDAELELEVRSLEQATEDYNRANPEPILADEGGGQDHPETPSRDPGTKKAKKDGKATRGNKKDADGDGIINEGKKP